MLGANRKSVTRVMGWTMSHLMSGERTVSTTASAKQILTMMEMGVQSVEKVMVGFVLVILKWL